MVRSIEMLPGPKGLPILGNMLQINPNHFPFNLEKWSDLFGSIYTFKYVFKPVVVISDTELVNYILRERPKRFRRWNKMASISRDLGYNPVVTDEGESWQVQRTIVMHAFKLNYLREYFPVIVKAAEQLKRRWTSNIDDKRNNNIQHDLEEFALSVITDLAFGCNVVSAKEKVKLIQQHLERIFSTTFRRFVMPLPYWRYIRLPGDKAFDKAVKETFEFGEEMIRLNRKLLAENSASVRVPSNLLQGMMLANEKEAILTDKEIIANAIAIVLAGHGTTAASLAWMVYFMTENKGIQNKMQEEADQALGDLNVVNNYEMTENLEYIDAVINEAMRLRSVSSQLFMECNEDVVLHNTVIPKDTLLILLTRYGSLQEKNFTLSEQFHPERWLTSRNETCARHHTKAFIPFGSGPHFCPGRNLAILEMKMVLVMLCRNFTVLRMENGSFSKEQFMYDEIPKKLNFLLEPRR